jgi:hypothetical protein
MHFPEKLTVDTASSLKAVYLAYYFKRKPSDLDAFRVLLEHDAAFLSIDPGKLPDRPARGYLTYHPE